ncbi:MAG: ribose-phosphate pyrophosphokinase [Dehalococcoidia bacterium]|nr:ribose-phosphate pyrophosphokinase [Dehalococcoidia bacterium]
MPFYEELTVFTGNANRQLAADVCAYLRTPLGRMEVFKFTNDNTFVRILENVRQRDVFLVQPFSHPVNDHVMELLIMIDAAKRASAGRITAVIPYFGYGRTDKKDQPRVPITARLLADIITTAGADRVLTVDLHAGQIQGFFNLPVDELTALPIYARHLAEKELRDPVVVAVDIGGTKRARDLAEHLSAPLAIVEKRRTGNDGVTEQMNIIGDVAERTAILVDDEVDTAGSMLGASVALLDAGVERVYACATHGVLSGPAPERLRHAPIEELILTDSIPVPEEKRDGKIKVLSIAGLLGEAIHRIHGGHSVGEMFERP